MLGEFCFASSIETENMNQPTSWSSQLLLTQDLKPGTRHSSLKDFTLSYTYSLMAPDSTSLSPAWIETDAYGLGFDWEFGARKEWSSNFTINSSNQPAEKFTTGGIEYDLWRKLKFGSDEIKPTSSEGGSDVITAEKETENFQPSLEFGFKLGFTILNQKAKVKIGKILVNDLVEPQSKSGVNLKYSFAEFASFYSEYNGYKYNPSISNFMTFLNNVNPVSATGMSTAIGQLNIYDWTNKITFYIGNNWEWYVGEQISEALNGGAVTYLYLTSLEYSLSKSFTIEVGGGQSFPLNQYEATFNLTYDY